MSVSWSFPILTVHPPRALRSREASGPCLFSFATPFQTLTAVLSTSRPDPRATALGDPSIRPVHCNGPRRGSPFWDLPFFPTISVLSSEPTSTCLARSAEHRDDVLPFSP